MRLAELRKALDLGRATGTLDEVLVADERLRMFDEGEIAWLDVPEATGYAEARGILAEQADNAFHWLYLAAVGCVGPTA